MLCHVCTRLWLALWFMDFTSGLAPGLLSNTELSITVICEPCQSWLTHVMCLASCDTRNWTWTGNGTFLFYWVVHPVSHTLNHCNISGINVQWKVILSFNLLTLFSNYSLVSQSQCFCFFSVCHHSCQCSRILLCLLLWREEGHIPGRLVQC